MIFRSPGRSLGDLKVVKGGEFRMCIRWSSWSAAVWMRCLSLLMRRPRDLRGTSTKVSSRSFGLSFGRKQIHGASSVVVSSTMIRARPRGR